MQSNYYQKAVLNYVVKQSDPLFDNLEEKGNIFNYNQLIYKFLYLILCLNFPIIQSKMEQVIYIKYI